MMQEIMAGKLGIEVGKYTHIADSFHIYEMHFDMAEKIIANNQYKLYSSTMDARIGDSELNNELNGVMDIEATTRLQGMIIDVNTITSMLDNIKNEYWKSLAAVIATYNFKKHNREDSEKDLLRTYITNEFKGLL